jgi:hypothetical protein
VIKFRPSWRASKAASAAHPSYGYPLGVPLVPWQVITDLAAHPAPASAYGEKDHGEFA